MLLKITILVHKKTMTTDDKVGDGLLQLNWKHKADDIFPCSLEKLLKTIYGLIKGLISIKNCGRFALPSTISLISLSVGILGAFNYIKQDIE